MHSHFVRGERQPENVVRDTSLFSLSSYYLREALLSRRQKQIDRVLQIAKARAKASRGASLVRRGLRSSAHVRETRCEDHVPYFELAHPVHEEARIKLTRLLGALS